MELQKFNVSSKNYQANAPIYRDLKTIGYKFVNTGNCIVYLNEIKLYPSDELSTFAPLMNDQTLYRVRFDTTNANQSCSTSAANLQVLIFSTI